MPSDWQGGCLCGAVRYSITRPIPAKRITHCYCGQCRRGHGAAYATYGVVPRKHFELRDSLNSLRRYRSSSEVERSFCGECGSTLFWEHAQHSGLIDVAIGTLDEAAAAQVEIGANIFAAARAPWVALDRRLPSYAGFVGSAPSDPGPDGEASHPDAQDPAE